VRATDAVFLGVVAAARQGIAAGELAELKVAPPFKAAARFGYVTLAGRTEAPVMTLFRQFAAQHLCDRGAGTR
jgi:hypothetical protein